MKEWTIALWKLKITFCLTSLTDGKMNITNINFLSFSVSGGRVDPSSMKTSYACQGDTLNLTCPSGHVIKIMRANYGRFSVGICNEHGITDWSVNCMAPRSLRILQDRYQTPSQILSAETWPKYLLWQHCLLTWLSLNYSNCCYHVAMLMWARQNSSATMKAAILF